MKRLAAGVVMTVVMAGIGMAQSTKPPSPSSGQGSTAQAPKPSPEVMAQKAEEMRTAQKNAGAWMRLVDDGDYAGSYEQSSTIFQKAFTKDEWSKKIAAVRQPLGKALSHNVAGERYTTTLRGAPEGEYVVLRLNSVFENRKSVLETLVLMLDKDEHWRVTAYSLKDGNNQHIAGPDKGANR